MNRWLLILIYIANFSGRCIYKICGNDTAYFIGDALSWLIASIYILKKTGENKEIDKWEQELAKGLLLVVISNTLDEAFFDPVIFNINEYLLISIIIVRLVYIYTKK